MAVNQTAQSVAVKQNWVKSGSSYVGDRPDGAAVVYELLASLSGAGRFSFYQDYSERSTVGTHTFYVARTHGSSGAVTVDYATAGDSHTTASGTLSWADGDISVKAFTVDVDSKSNGEHRIYATLSNPTGGAALHFGSYTVAYGVIDDDTIAADSNAVFVDEGAGVNGTGTQASPYDNIYDAISNVGSSKRYIYCKGTTTPDTTNTCNPNGGGGIVNCINFPATRTGESDRLIIRNWPGFTWTVTGGAGNEHIGFYSNGSKDYITFKGIDFSALSAWSGVGSKFSEGGGISCHIGSSEGINVEHCTFDDIDGSTNTAGFNPYLVDGAKVWRCTFNNIQVNGDNTNANSSGVLTYSGKNISVQRCEFTNAHSGVYQKRVQSIGDVTIAASFNKFKGEVGVLYGTAGEGNSHSYSICRSNLFKGCTQSGIDHNNIFQTSTLGEKHFWANNVFDSCGSGEIAAITFQYAYSAQIFNNIMLDCRKVWADVQDRSSLKTPDVEYADYNNETGTTLTSQRYEYRAVNYSTASALDTAFGFATNDAQTAPSFTNTATDDYTTALSAGVGGSAQGIYLTGIEVLGA